MSTCIFSQLYALSEEKGGGCTTGLFVLVGNEASGVLVGSGEVQRAIISIHKSMTGKMPEGERIDCTQKLVKRWVLEGCG
ncbi:MAG: hypothetical protein ACO3GN_03690 [Bacteroidia bacterium]